MRQSPRNEQPSLFERNIVTLSNDRNIDGKLPAFPYLRTAGKSHLVYPHMGVNIFCAYVLGRVGKVKLESSFWARKLISHAKTRRESRRLVADNNLPIEICSAFCGIGGCLNCRSLLLNLGIGVLHGLQLATHFGELACGDSSVNTSGKHDQKRADNIGLRMRTASSKTLPPVQTGLLIAAGVL
jgi:hypothetical protein